MAIACNAAASASLHGTMRNISVAAFKQRMALRSPELQLAKEERGHSVTHGMAQVTHTHDFVHHTFCFMQRTPKFHRQKVNESKVTCNVIWRLLKKKSQEVEKWFLWCFRRPRSFSFCFLGNFSCTLAMQQERQLLRAQRGDQELWSLRESQSTALGQQPSLMILRAL